MKVISQSKQLSSVQNAKKPVKTSIICTIGPRSSSCEMLEKLIQEGWWFFTIVIIIFHSL